MSNPEAAEERRSDAEAVLRRVWQQQRPTIGSESDAIVFAVYCAFLGIGCRGTRSDTIDENWNTQATYSFELRHESLSPLIEVKALVLATSLVVYARISSENDSFSTRFKVVGGRMAFASFEELRSVVMAPAVQDRIEKELVQPIRSRVEHLLLLSTQEELLRSTLETVLPVAACKSSADTLCVALHCIFLNDSLRVEDTTEGRHTLPRQGWNSSTVYQFTYGIGSQHFDVKCFPLGEFLVVSAQNSAASAGTSLHPVCSLRLVISRFVDSSTGLLKALPTLISVVHNSISKLLWPSVFIDTDKSVASHFVSLLPSLQLSILSFLDAGELASMALVDSYFHMVSNAPMLWKALCVRQLKRSDPKLNCKHFKNEFIARFLEKKLQQVPTRPQLQLLNYGDWGHNPWGHREQEFFFGRHSH